MLGKSRLLRSLLALPFLSLAASTARADEPPAAPAPEATPKEPDPAPPAANVSDTPVQATGARAPFGSKGQIALDDLFGFHLQTVAMGTQGALSSTLSVSGIVSYETQTSSVTTTPTAPGTLGYSASMQSTRLTLAPSLDYFVSDRISVGGVVAVGYQRSRMTNAPGTGMDGTFVQSGYALSLRPRIGYVLPLTDDIVLWPRIGVGYDVSRASSDEGPEGRTLAKTLTAEADLGVIVRMGRHAYLNVGPTLAYYSRTSESNNPTNPISSDGSGLGGGVRGTFGVIF
jgi:hypothetical protein